MVVLWEVTYGSLPESMHLLKHKNIVCSVRQMTDGCLKLFRDAFENCVSMCCPLVCSVFLCLRDWAVTFYLKFEIPGKEEQFNL